MKTIKKEYVDIDLIHTLNYINDLYIFDFLAHRLLEPFLVENNIFVNQQFNKLKIRMSIIKNIFDEIVQNNKEHRNKNTNLIIKIEKNGEKKIKMSSIASLNKFF